MNKFDQQEIALDLFLEALKRVHGYDYQNYARASLRRRVVDLCQEQGFKHIEEMIPQLLSDADFLEPVIQHLSIPVTEMFRDPFVFKSIREKVLPLLASYPKICIWIAGCATGEEVWTMAILLEEANLLSRCQIYATDINPTALETARNASIPLDKLKAYSKAYFRSGGQQSLLDYFNIAYGYGRVIPKIRQQVNFESHNLVSDTVFCQPQLILCRNVFIYFNCELQHHVISLFYQSLDTSGILCIGSQESLDCYKNQKNFLSIDRKSGLYKKQLQHSSREDRLISHV